MGFAPNVVLANMFRTAYSFHTLTYFDAMNIAINSILSDHNLLCALFQHAVHKWSVCQESHLDTVGYSHLHYYSATHR